MEILSHQINNKKIAEIISNDIILSNVDDALDLIGNLGYQKFDKVIIYEKNIIADFFDLRTKIAGDILQKFTQYNMPLIIIGTFAKYKSKSLEDFIFESNKKRQINFLPSLDSALNQTSNP